MIFSISRNPWMYERRLHIFWMSANEKYLPSNNKDFLIRRELLRIFNLERLMAIKEQKGE